MNQKYNKDGNKTKVKSLINRVLFDNHIDELSKALYTNRLFTKDIKCYFNKINNNKIDNSINPIDRNKIFLNNNKSRNSKSKFSNFSSDKKISTDINSYELVKHKEDEINSEMIKLLKLLNISQDETNKKFQKIKNENDFFSKLYKLYKDLIDRAKKNNKNNDDNDVLMFLYDLLIKYKSNKNLTFNMDSLFSDILRETPLATNDPEKLKFYYIINSERFDNLENNAYNMNIKKEKKTNPLFGMFNYHSEDNSLSKIKVTKEPKTIDMTKIENLKEIKFLNKVDRRAKFKIIRGGRLMGFTPFKQVAPKLDKINFSSDEINDRYMKNEEMEEFAENQFNFGKLENTIDKIKNKPVNIFGMKLNKKKLKLDIDKDIIDINILKKTIKDSFQFEKKGSLRLKKQKSLFFSNKKMTETIDKKKSSFSLSRNNNSDKKENTFISKDKTITFKENFNILEPIIKKTYSRKLTKNDKFKNINDNNQIDNSNIVQNNSPFSSQNNYQTTFFTNQSNSNINFSNLNQISSNKSINFNINTPKKKVKIFEQSLISSSEEKNNLFNSTKLNKTKKNKNLKKSKSVFPYEKNNNALLNNIIDNQTDNIYSISKNINAKNNKSTIKKINEYLKYKNSRLPLIYKGNTLKDTYYFFHRIKNSIQNNEIKYKFQNVRKIFNDKEKKKLNDIVLLESNLVNKEKELLLKVLKNKI